MILYYFTLPPPFFFTHIFTVLAEEDACFVLSVLKTNQCAYMNYWPGLEQLC